MVIRNIMEDIVYEKVNKLFDETRDAKEEWLTCSCLQCRLDTMCYVLNRVKPRYIKSGKGFAHFLNTAQNERNQLMADVSALVIEGMHKVSEVQRPHLENELGNMQKIAYFNFPTISGKIMNGTNFNQMSDVKMMLCGEEDKLTPQVDILWDNPYVISDKTAGTFIFSPKSIKTEKAGETRKFRFFISAEKEGFESANYSFEIEITSEEEKKSAVEYSNSYKVKNLFLFPCNEE